MPANMLTLAYLQTDFSKEEQAELDQALKQRVSTLRPNINSLDTRRRVRHTPSEIQARETQAPELLSAYRQTARGQQPYCSSRTSDPRPRPYHRSTPDRPCSCGVSHGVPNPKDWQSSLAEAPEWDYSLPNGGHPIGKSKVTFANPLVTIVKEFERWYADIYGPFSKRGITNDKSTEADDDAEIQMLDDIDSRFAKSISEQDPKSLELNRAFSNRKDSKRWCGDTFDLARSTKEVSAEVDDGGEVRGLDAAEPAKAVRDERPKVKSLRKVPIGRRRQSKPRFQIRQ